MLLLGHPQHSNAAQKYCMLEDPLEVLQGCPVCSVCAAAEKFSRAHMLQPLTAALVCCY